jgi:hypothetical protein
MGTMLQRYNFSKKISVERFKDFPHSLKSNDLLSLTASDKVHAAYF